MKEVVNGPVVVEGRQECSISGHDKVSISELISYQQFASEILVQQH